MSAIIVHGGAGKYTPGEAHERGLLAAVDAGRRVLDARGSAADAVEAAVVAMEDDPIFNAGYGSSINLAGLVQNDASFMLDDLSCGAVGAMTAAANPIRAARLVMERTDHVLLAGEGADEFARRMGLPSRDQRTEHRMRLYRERLADLREGRELRYMPRLRRVARDLGLGTVGAVAIDDGGRIAVGTSTGGTMMKLPGRIGDTGVIGAGTFADGRGGASSTGHGESIIRHGMARAVVEAMGRLGARGAVDEIVESGRKHGVEFGIIGIDAAGQVASGHTTEGMSWAAATPHGIETFLRGHVGEPS